MARRRAQLDPKLEAALPWAASFLLHAALSLIGIFVLFIYTHERDKSADHVIVIPNAFEDPSYHDQAGPAAPGAGNDPLHQTGLKDIARSEGWDNTGTSNVAALVGGHDPAGIFAGSGASISPGQPTNNASAYGTPGAGAGVGPRSTFYGTGGNATKIVYILDRSGSMVSNFDSVQDEAKASINKLSANQFFCVIFVSETAKSVGAGPAHLQRALPEAKQDCASAIDKTFAEGHNDGLQAPFLDAFTQALSMDPDLIFFLTDGKFGDGLNAKVAELNKNKHAKIFTLAFVSEEPLYKAQLQELAQQNGGTYKFVPK